MNILLLNGPPRSGKDTAARLISETMKERDKTVYHTKFAKQLKERTHAMYGLFDSFGAPRAHDFFEAVKDLMIPEFYGLTPRRAYIAASETYWKPQHGHNIFGKLLALELQNLSWTPDLVVISDSGFEAEAMELIRIYGRQSVRLLQLSREGTSFKGDSRGYIALPCETFAVNNDGTLEQLKTALV